MKALGIILVIAGLLIAMIYSKIVGIMIVIVGILMAIFSQALEKKFETKTKATSKEEFTEVSEAKSEEGEEVK